MKYVVAALAAACSAAAASPPAPQGADLRRALVQVRQGTAAPAERQLSPDQRAELRRQLVEAKGPARRKQ